jgi:glyoxylase-like metal-dependent hydrolase (beta-lactamase superfamily II)
MSKRQPRRPIAVLAVALLITGCGASAHRTVAAPRPPAVPGQAKSGPDLTGVKLPNFIMPLISGGISFPKRALTPGAVTTADANTICNLPHRLPAPQIAPSVQLAVFRAYGYAAPAIQKKYILDLLVPVSLGGTSAQANIWPAAIRGTGFFQKQQLDHILKDMVCHRQVTLGDAQRALETQPAGASMPRRGRISLARQALAHEGSSTIDQAQSFFLKSGPGSARSGTILGRSSSFPGRKAMQARIDRVARTVNTWIVGDDEEVIVVDPGDDAAAVLAVVDDRQVLAVICTHGHARHVSAAFEVAKRDDAPVAVHSGDVLAWRDAHPGADPDIEMEDGGIFEVAGVTLEVIHAPGHSPGSACLYSEELGVVLTGDVVGGRGPVPHEKAFPDFPRQLSAIGGTVLTLDGETRILPGHGDELTVSAAERRFDSWVSAGPGDLADDPDD